jgi:succinate-semialdehyde dehydrogenase/glutarate-semialdehyde dehydrogenase
LSETLTSRNPATLESVGTVETASADDVDAAVERARKAQRAWAETSLDQRIDVLERFNDLLLDRKGEFTELVARETGKPPAEAVAADIFPVVDAVRFVRDEGPEVLEERLSLSNPMLMDRSSRLLREPVGVVGLVTPWNYPLAIPGSQLVYVLFAGNAAVLKPSEMTPLVAGALADLLEEAGLPEGVLQVVQGEGVPTGEALVASDVDQVTFTGSVRVGEQVAEACSDRGVPYCLELGGSDPAVVLEDANLDLTSDGIVWARFTNAGQTCAAVKRVVAHEAVADDLTERIAAKTRSLRVGNAFEEDVDVGPVISGDALEFIERVVEESVDMGATVLAGGERLDRDGHFFQPTVLADVTPEMPVVQEETFGPVLPILRAGSVDAAVEMANDTEYGLTASVWSRDLDRAQELARELEAGTVTVNDHTYTYAANETPWGGTKASGKGHTHGVWGLEEVTTLKHVNVAAAETFPRSLRTRNIWWFPYEEDQEETMSQGLDVLYGDGVAGRARALPQVMRKLLGKGSLPEAPEAEDE